jgi:hypothetical protein
MVYKTPQCGWHIAQAKGHDKVFVVVVASLKSYLLLIAFLYKDCVKGMPKVDFGEDFSVV